MIALAAVFIIAAVTVVFVIKTGSAPAVVTEEIGTETAPDTYYYDGYSIKLLAEDNATVPFDINMYTDEDGTVWFFLPCEVDKSDLVFHLYDTDGADAGTVAAQFTENRINRIIFSNTTLDVGVMQTDLPSLSLTLDSESPKIDEITADKQKSITGYGDLSLFVPAELASEYGCGTVFSSDENNEDSPGSITLKGRGHSSWMYLDKKNFSVKFEKSVSLLGMSKAKSWALISNHFDRSLIRNTVIYDIADSLGFYTEYRCVELYVDGDYYGSYQLTGKIKIGSGRINITDLEKKNEKLAGNDYPPKNSVTVDLPCGATVKYWADMKSPDDVTGGYLIEVDIASRAKKEPSYIKTSRDIYYIISSPEYMSRDEAFYLAEFLQGFEDAIYSEDGYNHQGNHITDYADLNTLALRYLVDEMCRNPDGGETSTFFYKDSDKKDGKLYSGPLWDYDLAMGNYSGYSATDGYESRKRFYYPELFRHKIFTDELRRNYDKVKSLFETEINEKIDVYREYIRKSADMNFKRWKCMDTEIRVAPAKAAKSFDQACDYIKEFLQNRLSWIDKNIYKEFK